MMAGSVIIRPFSGLSAWGDVSIAVRAIAYGACVIKVFLVISNDYWHLQHKKFLIVYYIVNEQNYFI
jgi:hypothetical protein